MPKYGIFLIGERTSPRKIFGWRSTDLAQDQLALVSGPYKMVSLFMRVLLTPKGDIIGRPDEGTEFYDLITGNVQDSYELQARIEGILEDCFQQVQLIQQQTSLSGEIEQDEILVAYSIEELYISTDGTQATARVELRNSAGETVPGVIPLNGPLAP